MDFVRGRRRHGKWACGDMMMKQSVATITLDSYLIFVATARTIIAAAPLLSAKPFLLVFVQPRCPHLHQHRHHWVAADQQRVMKYAAVRMGRVAHDGMGVHFVETIAAKEDRRDAKETMAGAQRHLVEVAGRDASDCALRSLRHPWRNSCRVRSRRSACSCE